MIKSSIVNSYQYRLELSHIHRITSYINNLHPAKHKPLYEVIEHIIKIAIPLWNQTLTPLNLPVFNCLCINYKYCQSDPDWPSQLTGEDTNNYVLSEIYTLGK